MIVNAATHVLDVDVPQPFAPLAKLVRDGHFAQAMQMADVEREAEEGMIDARVQLGEAVHRVDEHARLRLEGQAHLAGLGVTAQLHGSPRPGGSRCSSGDAASIAAPDQKLTASEPSSAAMSTARLRKSSRLSRPGGGLSSVGWCLRRGSSRKRAPVSTTEAHAVLVQQRLHRRQLPGASRDRMD